MKTLELYLEEIKTIVCDLDSTKKKTLFESVQEPALIEQLQDLFEDYDVENLKDEEK